MKTFTHVFTTAAVALSLFGTVGLEQPFPFNIPAQTEQPSAQPVTDNQTTEINLDTLAENPETGKTEEDVFSSVGPFFTQGMKAIHVNYFGLDLYVLTDLAGSFFVTKEELVHGKNYTVQTFKYDDNMYRIEEGNFTFTFEEDFHDLRLMKEEIYNILDSKETLNFSGL